MKRPEIEDIGRQRTREAAGNAVSEKRRYYVSYQSFVDHFSKLLNIKTCNVRRSVSAANRGQTLYDYTVGIGLFLVIVTGVLVGVLPTVLAPFDDTVGGDKAAQADRITERIVANSSVDGEANLLDSGTLESVVMADQGKLRDRFTLPSTTRMNVTVTTMDGSRVVDTASGETLATAAGPGQRPAATSARIVRLSDESCPTACRLVVRVW